MKILWITVVSLAMLVMASNAFAESQVSMNLIDAQGTIGAAGTVVLKQSTHGLVFTPNLNGLTPGLHGFHVHQNSSCAPAEKNAKMVAGLAAGGHFDPHNTNRHDLPWGDGHLGDLPALYVDGNGHAGTPVLAPRLTLNDVKGRALMIHAGGDNYSDQPKKLGGGGARMACGVID